MIYQKITGKWLKPVSSCFNFLPRFTQCLPTDSSGINPGAILNQLSRIIAAKQNGSIINKGKTKNKLQVSNAAYYNRPRIYPITPLVALGKPGDH
ncbi:MAG: hypothetical protein HYV28_05770 [Ignavibacteriales bacterium]|nr:hypothetical protein [Ignavibacteriales bacterium]